jgi:hypothetical protein
VSRACPERRVLIAATAKELENHVENLKEFRGVYLAYLSEGGSDRRNKVLRAIPAAQEALDLLGGGIVV